MWAWGKLKLPFLLNILQHIPDLTLPMNPALPICMFSAKENASEMIFVWAYSASHDYCDQSVLNMDTICYDTM